MKLDQKSHKKKYDSSIVNGAELKELKQLNIYFQKQSSTLLCGMHAINNFLGVKKYTSDDMNQICYSLAGGKKVMNPHKHWLMAGDFDVNVLMVALGREGYEANWHDKRKDFSSEVINNTQGFLINIEYGRSFISSFFLSCCHSGRHWLTVKKVPIKIQDQIQDFYVILDSLENVFRIINELQVIEYLKTVERQDGEVLLIQKQTQGVKKKNE